MLRQPTQDVIHVTSMQVYTIPTLNSGGMGEMGMGVIPRLGGDPIFTPVHGPHHVVISVWEVVLGRCMLAANLHKQHESRDHYEEEDGQGKRRKVGFNKRKEEE